MNPLKNIFDFIQHKAGWGGLVLLLLLEIFATFSCRKENADFESESTPLTFSTDTVFFDTVFSTLNTPVRRFTIRNNHKKAVKISRIYIKSGADGYGEQVFKYNVNGDTSKSITDLVIGGLDSVFVFIRLGVPLSHKTLPFLIEASFVCEVNNSQQSIVLKTYGQDAHYWTSHLTHKIPYNDPNHPGKIDTLYMPYFLWDPDSVITPDIPYVIFGYLTVSPGKTLEIPAGARLHFGPNSGIWVQQNAKLKVNGSLSAPVLFSGIRMDAAYKEEPGQWGKIWLGGKSLNHQIQYAIIENGSSGIWLDSSLSASLSNPGLILQNTIIKNMTNYGLVAFQNAISGTNVVIGSCEKALSLQQGGAYEFTHSTFTNYNPRSYSNATCLEMRDYVLNGSGEKTVYPFKNCKFINSIFYGSNSAQLSFDFTNEQTRPYTFDHCLIRQQNLQNPGELFIVCRFNLDPMFKDFSKMNFAIDTLDSPAVKAGNPTAVTGEASFDIKGKNRANVPTIGAYEFVPKQ